MTTQETEARKAWMGLMARSGDAATALVAPFAAQMDAEILRAPEIGSVMVRGRTGATGAPFNLGEMTVTRCALRLASGEVGHGYVQGRDKAAAEAAALVDALMQTEAADRVEAEVLAPLRATEDARQAERRAKAAATKVEFFTMTRGENK